MTLYADTVAALQRWPAPNAEQSRLRTAYLTHLAERPDALSRDCHPDHITASTLVVNRARDQVLLNLHGKYRIWVQFGGHCETEDRALHEAALREATEESGIDGLHLVSDLPIQLSAHEVRCGPIRPSHHLDVRYVAVAADDAVSRVSAESLDVAWFASEDLPEGLDAPLLELIGWALAT